VQYRQWFLFFFILCMVIALESLIFLYLPLETPSQKSATQIKRVHLHLITPPSTLPQPTPKEPSKKSLTKEPMKEIKKRVVKHQPQPKKVEKSVVPKHQPDPQPTSKPHSIVKKVSKKVEAEPTSTISPPPKPVSKPVQASTPQHPSSVVQRKKEEAVQRVDREQIDRIKSAYLKKVRETIERNKYYPRIAKKLHQTGVVEVQFTIQKDGHVCCFKILKASRYQRLNRSAKETIMRIEQFDPLPAVFETASLQISIPIVYRLH